VASGAKIRRFEARPHPPPRIARQPSRHVVGRARHHHVVRLDAGQGGVRVGGGVGIHLLAKEGGGPSQTLRINTLGPVPPSGRIGIDELACRTRVGQRGQQ